MGRIARFFTYSYLLRAPIALWLVLLFFVPAATSVPLFRGLLVFERPGEVFETSYIVFLSAAAMMVMANLVLLYGQLRVAGLKQDVPAPRQDHRRTLIVFLIGLLPALVFVIWGDVYTSLQNGVIKPPPIGPLAVYLLSGAGFLAAALTVLLAKILQMWFAEPFSEEAGALYLVFPMCWIPWFGKRIERLYQRRSPLASPSAARVVGWLTTPYRALMRRAGEGYYSFPRGGQMRLLPGHAFAFWLAILAWLSYLVSGAAHEREYFSPAATKPAWFPTVFHVLIAVLLASWLISSLAFFLDRYRVPVASVFIVGALLSLPSGDTDHVFDLAPAVKVTYPTPNEVLRKKPDRMIVVAAAGGGIQAAAWTAKVLGGLKETNSEFAGAVAAISGVSGGSVGTLHYLTTYPAVRSDPVSASQGFQNATEDSLEGVAWGMVHPDFWRVVFPWLLSPVVDRGWALERILAKRSGTTGLRLSDLAKAIDQGAPAVLINSTMTESGAPMVFASTQFPAPESAAGVYDFHRVYGDSDIGLATAVRLSATFPYVSPAARPSAAGVKPYHFVDGGYYDNYGMATLIAWLRDALLLTDPNAPPDPGAQRRRILIVQIIAFPPGGEPGADRQPWPFQLVAPLLTLYSAREHSQQARDNFEYELHEEGKLFPNVRVVSFYYNPRHCECQETPPLSWHLTKREIQCINYAWEDPNQKDAQATVSKFLHGTE